MRGNKAVAGAILVAKKSAVLMFRGKKLTIAADRTTVREGHPLLDGNERLFVELVPTYELDEDAESESKKAPARKTAAKKAAAKAEDGD